MSGTGAGSQMGAKETGSDLHLDSTVVPSVGSMGDLHCGRCTVINQAGSMSCETCAYVLISGTFFSRLLNGQSMDGSELYNFSLYLVAHSPKAGTTQLLPVHLPTVLGIGGRTRSMRSPWRTLPAALIFLPGTDSAVGTVFMGEKDSVGHFVFVHLVLLPDRVKVRTMDSMRQVSGTLARAPGSANAHAMMTMSEDFSRCWPLPSKLTGRVYPCKIRRHVYNVCILQAGI